MGFNPIDLKKLPREIRDRIELKMDTEPTFFRAVDEDYTDEFLSTIQSRSQLGSNHSYIASCYGGQGTGKSYTSLSACAMLDPNFSINNVFFNYQDLVYARRNLRPHTAVLVDEQSDAYGVDSHRVNIILGALKEQLRKKSIHFFFCSPTLKEEYQSSMYVIETMFIDYNEKLCYSAYKTRDLHTLGYIAVPHPEKLLGKDFLKAYEAKKDEHLDRLTGNKSIDDIEDQANKVIASDLFKKAEMIYRNRIGYVPMSMLFQIINKLYPDFRGSVIVGEIASRIKLNKEISGEWMMSGGSRKKKKDT